ncbi:hypothetical protein GOV08_00560 [Candidatus Woesearchaeota archaeon]|nr:hypothetical protein [Candidatus Woesearchaeota archaeon]
MKSKKAQITVFIIVGIILLFSSALIIYVKNKVTQTTPPPKIIQSVPEDLEGLNKYIEGCVYETAKEAVMLLGSSGGYIYPERFGVFASEIAPTEATGLEVFPGSGYIVPYWHYLSTSNNCNQANCKYAHNIPPLRNDQLVLDPKSIESQISAYVNNNLKLCTQEFNVFTQRGYTILEEGPIEARTTITLQDVVVDVKWPLEAGTTRPKKIERYLVRLPVNLRQTYELAQTLAKTQGNSSFLEVNTLNLIAMESDPQLQKLPPMADYSFLQSDIRTWEYDKTQEQLENLLSTWISAIRVKDTLNLQRKFYDKTIYQTVMDKMILDVSGEYQLKTTFRYSTFWPFYFDITPRNGNTITPKTLTLPFLSFIGIGINQFEFQYDLSYPVLVEIYDPSAFNNEGYGFVFALEANIRNNRPLKADFESFSVIGAEQSFVCDEEQKGSGNITVNTFDWKTGEPLEDVGVIFAFPNEACSMGTTSTKASLVERYPLGIGAIGAVKQPDYLSEFRTIGIGEGKEYELNFSLYPMEEKEINLKKYDMSKPIINNSGFLRCGAWQFNETPRDITENETVNLFIKRVQSAQSPDNVFGSAIFNGSKKELHKMTLAPGKYEVRVQATLNERVAIPRYEGKVGGGLFKKPKKYTLKEIELYPYNEGTLELNNETFYFEIIPEDLYSNKTLEFYAVTYDLSEVPEDIRGCRKHETDVSPDPNKIALEREGLITPKFI